MTILSPGQQQFRKLEIQVPQFFFEEDLLTPYRLEEEEENEVEEIEKLKKDQEKRIKEELQKKADKGHDQTDRSGQG